MNLRKTGLSWSIYCCPTRRGCRDLLQCSRGHHLTSSPIVSCEMRHDIGSRRSVSMAIGSSAGGEAHIRFAKRQSKFPPLREVSRVRIAHKGLIEETRVSAVTMHAVPAGPPTAFQPVQDPSRQGWLCSAPFARV